MQRFTSSFSYKLIYVFAINDKRHKDMLKVGDASIDTDKAIDELAPNCHDLNEAAKTRINQYTQTAQTYYNLLYTEIAAYRKEVSGKVKVCGFRDHDVHRVLTRSGIKRHYFDGSNRNEWFETNLETVKEAVKAVKEGRSAIDVTKVTDIKEPFLFRPEQEDAIKKTIKQFKNSDRMLWNAKMRFGKTACALELVKREGFEKTIILTHRPVVNEGWFDDFKKVFYDTDEYLFGSKTIGHSIEDLQSSGKKFVYFASIQDLRGSERVNGRYNKNAEIFDESWDLVIVDEAHEGTQTDLGSSVISEILKNVNSDKKTKRLDLSGTPFNLMDEFTDTEIYTWDYVMEQSAKEKWDFECFGDTNPYADLPKMEIYTYDLKNLISGGNYVDIEDKAFNFREFFRVWTGDIERDKKQIPKGVEIGDFVHKEDIVSFLNLMTKFDGDSNYPYSSDTYRDYFRHTLWILPGVKEAKAMSKLLQSHNVFSGFKIVNVAGEGDEEEANEEALSKVKNAIGANPEDTYTITLSCGRLTTGVTVPEWTAVFYLAGAYSTAASSYMQTIFRVQSPGQIGGKVKEKCYVFDFAPDRTLKIVAETSQYSRGGNNDSQNRLGEFLNFCPIIAVEGSSMKQYSADALVQQLKRVYTDRVVRNGFDDIHLYNDKLLKLSDDDLVKFDDLKKIVGTSKQQKPVRDIDINNEGLTDEEYEIVERAKKKQKKNLTEEEKEALEKRKNQLEQRSKAISILRGISIRIPLLMYGLDGIPYDQDISPEKLAKLVDDESWKEFMPEGVTKEKYLEFIKYYDRDIFIAAGKRIRAIAKSADELPVTERVKKITELMSQFKNPDKETVLTPWRVVNLHMSDSFGGYDFYDKDHTEVLDEPRLVKRYIEENDGKKDDITEEVFSKPDVKILEINSKTGLYPLYAAYSIYRFKLEKSDGDSVNRDKLWKEVLDQNIFVICKTPMAKTITKRTLLGYKPGRINAHYFEDLINQLKNKSRAFVDKVKDYKCWGNRRGKMRIDAVIGNPPYQGENHSQIYPYFYKAAKEISDDYVSLIFPTGWQQPKAANNLKLLNNKETKEDKQIMYINNLHNVFQGVSGVEWVNIVFWKNSFDNMLDGKQNVYENGKNPVAKNLSYSVEDVSKPAEILRLAETVKTCLGHKFEPLSNITSVSKPYGLRKDVFHRCQYYNLVEMNRTRSANSDIKIYGSRSETRYIPYDYALPRKTRAFDKFKVFVGSAWGNMGEKAGLGGAYSDIILAGPNEICTETYVESGCFDDLKTARKHAKYLMTKFARALLYVNKISQMSTTAWGAIPIQDYSEDWWDKSISEIDEKLFAKYGVDADVADFVRKHIQTKAEENIINFNRTE